MALTMTSEIVYFGLSSAARAEAGHDDQAQSYQTETQQASHEHPPIR